MFQSIAISIAFLSSFLGKTAKNFWEENSWNYDLKFVKIHTNLIAIEYFLNNEQLDDLLVGKILGIGSFGIVFSAENSEKRRIAIKVHLECDANYMLCSTAYQTQQILKNGPVGKYIIDMEKPIKFHSPAQTREIVYENGLIHYIDIDPSYVCVLKMETGISAAMLFFEAKNLKENTKKMVNFIVRVLEAFKILNFDMGYYHGDVKPGNLLFVINQSSGEYEPRLIDFDYTFNPKISPDYPINQLYTDNYRAPELYIFIKITPSSKSQTEIKNQELMHKKYEFDAQFKEEAYAVGITISEILSGNIHCLDIHDKNLRRIYHILNKMILKQPELRISTEEAHKMLLSELDRTLI